MYWKNRKILVTGGASFIGSHLVDRLVEQEAVIRVIDNLSSGRIENIANHIDAGRVEFHHADLKDQASTQRALDGMETVFHLAADHGGRGYVELHQAGPASNLFLDGMLFRESVTQGIEKIVYASSGCVYPNHIQTNPSELLYLTEEMVGPPYDADNMYGWAKLMAEMTLQSYYKEHGLKSASCRYFTVFGPRGKEDHAIIAMIAKAFIQQTPFEVWGDGEQIRNWTYVDDIVEGTLLAGEKIEDGSAINLGTTERTRVLDAVRMVMDFAGHEAPVKLLRDMPTGPKNRVASNSLAKKMLDWEPKTLFREGLKRTIDWYWADREGVDLKSKLKEMLTER